MALLCIHSLATTGMVGLRPFLAVWPDQLLPVPSLLLNAPGNHPGCRRHATPLAEHLEDVLAIVEAPVDVFVGYLADAEQIRIVLSAVRRHRSRVRRLIVDPVCGDQGRAYVHPDLLAAWPALIAEAELALPNSTELALLSGGDASHALTRWIRRFPGVDTLVTGVVGPTATIGTELHRGGRPTFSVVQPYRPGHYRGTGDAFAALLLRDHLCRNLPIEDAIRRATSGVLQAIDQAAARRSEDLVLGRED